MSLPLEYEMDDGVMLEDCLVWQDDLRREFGRGASPFGYSPFGLAVGHPTLGSVLPQLGEWHVERIYAISRLSSSSAREEFGSSAGIKLPACFCGSPHSRFPPPSAIDRSEAWSYFYIYLTVLMFYAAILR